MPSYIKILILFFLFIFNAAYADDWVKADFDYKDYRLEGKYNDSRFTEDYYELYSEFFMQDGYILYLPLNEGTEYTFLLLDIPEGEYELTTKNGTEIKVKVGRKSLVEELYFKGSRENFENKEKKIEKNLCEEGLSYYWYNFALKKEPRTINIVSKDSGETIYGFLDRNFDDKSTYLSFKYKDYIMFYNISNIMWFEKPDLNKNFYGFTKDKKSREYIISNFEGIRELLKSGYKLIMITNDCSIEHWIDKRVQLVYKDTEEIVLPNKNL